MHPTSLSLDSLTPRSKYKDTQNQELICPRVLTKEVHLAVPRNPGFDFNKLIQIKKVADGVGWEKEITLQEGTEQIEEIWDSPPLYDGLWQILSWMLVAAVISFLYNVGWQDFLLSMLLGMCAGVLSLWKTLGASFQIVAGFVVGTIAILFHNLVSEVNIFAVSISGVGNASK